MAFDFDAYRVEKHHASDVGRTQQRHFGGDPTAHGVTDDGHVLESEFVEQAPVERGELCNVVESLWPRCAAEPGMRGRDYPVVFIFGQKLSKLGYGLWAGTTMKHKIRPSFPTFLYGQLDGADALGIDVLGR